MDISYDGTHYHGWQIQKNAISVQEVISDKLSTLLGSKTEIIGSGRTDSGVHARQQIFHTDIADSVELDRLVNKLNSFLPSDIAVNQIQKVKSDAHARFDAIKRSYCYTVTLGKDPFLSDYAWFLKKSPDIDRMNKAASYLVGKKDFTSFSRVRTDVNHFVCNIVQAEWVSLDRKLEFRISADRFLRGMVRAIVGTLKDIGLGLYPPEEIKRIIEDRDRKSAGSAAPAKGLFLTSVQYPDSVYID